MSSKRIVCRNGPTYNSLLEYYRSHARAANLQVALNAASQSGDMITFTQIMNDFTEAKERYVRAAERVAKEDADYRERQSHAAKAKAKKGTT